LFLQQLFSEFKQFFLLWSRQFLYALVDFLIKRHVHPPEGIAFDVVSLDCYVAAG
jgi:hypothetical protein